MGGERGADLRQQPGQPAKKLIAATVAVVDEGDEPPPDLILAWWTGDPLLDNALNMDYQMLYRRVAVRNIWLTLVRLRNLKGEEIHQLTDTERKILKMLRNEGMI